MLLELDQIIQNEFDIEGPRWGQKYYVSYPVNNYNWLRVHTKPKALLLDFLVKAGVFKTEDLAKRLGVEEYDVDDSLSEKFTMPSSVFVKNRNPASDRVRLRTKEDFNFKSEAFLEFLKEAHKAFPK